MNRWLGLLAVVCIAPVRLEAQDTTTVSKADTAPPPALPQRSPSPSRKP